MLVWFQADVTIKKRKLDSNLRSEFETNLNKMKQHLDEMEVLVPGDSKIVVLEQSHIEHKSIMDLVLKFGQDIIAKGLNGNCS